MKQLLLTLIAALSIPMFASAQAINVPYHQDDRYYPRDDRYYPMPPQPLPQQPQRPTPAPRPGTVALLSCDISYTSPDGVTTAHYVNQKFDLPLARGVMYYDSIMLGARQLDYAAENVGGRKMVSLTLWHTSGVGTVCETEKENVASCTLKVKTNLETANIVCRRI